MILTPQDLSRRRIRRAQYVSCDDAFIDVRLPGSTPKENYAIVGPGVTQNATQVIKLREPHGFNIGAAGMAPGITNNLYLHFRSEVFLSPAKAASSCAGAPAATKWQPGAQEPAAARHDGMNAAPLTALPGTLRDGHSQAALLQHFLADPKEPCA